MIWSQNFAQYCQQLNWTGASPQQKCRAKRKNSLLQQIATLVLAALILVPPPMWSARIHENHGETNNASQTFPTVTEEYLKKARFISTFPDFIQWPDQTFDAPKTPFLFCIYSAPAFANVVSEITRMKAVDFRRPDGTVDHHPVEVRGISKQEDIHDCRILFIGQSQVKHYAAILASARTSAPSVLTVGESRDFLFAGGGIALCYERQKLYLELNTVTTKEANLKISQKLLDMTRLMVIP